MAVTEELVLVGIASDGSVEQWDRHPTPAGVLLRWFADPVLGFPEYGFDLHRARLDDVPPLGFDKATADAARGRTQWAYPVPPAKAEVLLHADQGLSFSQAQHNADRYHCVVAPGADVQLHFPDPAWYLALEAGDPPTSLTVQLYANGQLRETAQWVAGGWFRRVTRGVDRVILRGEGQLATVVYRLLDSPAQWDHLVHRCLPIQHPGYPCSSQPQDEEKEATSRLPVPVQQEWQSRYADGFKELSAVLRGMATGQPPTAVPGSADPDAPTMRVDDHSLVRLATLDPHLARVVGLAYDDPSQGQHAPGPTPGQVYSYKIVGRWAGQPEMFEPFHLNTVRRAGITLSGATARPTARGTSVFLRTGASGSLQLGGAADHAELDGAGSRPIAWSALDATGTVLDQGDWTPASSPLAIVAPGMVEIAFAGPARFSIQRLAVTRTVERVGLLPGIMAVDPGPPTGPTWITARIEQPGGASRPIEAALDWELPATGERSTDTAVFHQLFAVQTSADPADPQPSDPPFDPGTELEGGLVAVPADLAPPPPGEPQTLLLDRGQAGTGLPEGWRAWWVRGVDLFGRVSHPSAPATGRIEDVGRPPAPVLLQAEHVQANLPTAAAEIIGRSVGARRWLAANPGSDAVTVTFAWTPELDAACGDVDAFTLHLRHPTPTPGGGPYGAEDTWTSPWPSEYAAVGPTAIRFPGLVTGDATPGIERTILVSSVIPLDDTHSRLVTDLDLDTGAGLLVGDELELGGTAHQVHRSGEGPSTAVTVSHARGAAPQPGTATFLPASSTQLLTVVTDIPPPSGLSSDPQHRRVSGALVVGHPPVQRRLLVLAAAGGTFWCQGPEDPSERPRDGEPVAWYPAYSITVADSGFGPSASATRPVARSQVAVRAVRRVKTRPRPSEPSVPTIITAVDATPPATPSVEQIPAGLYCAEEATRADWHGVSTFELGWTPTAGVQYHVERALADAVYRLDRRAFPNGARPTLSALPGGDPLIVAADVAALDAALASGDGPAIDAAYASLRADTARVLAAQPAASAAFARRTGEPLRPTSTSRCMYVDELNGRSKAHWFYRLVARSAAGLESAASIPTPPICAPDAVAPEAPSALVALAAAGQVKLRWSRPPDPDVAAFSIHRSDRELTAAELRNDVPIATVPSAALPPGVEVEHSVSAAPGEALYWVVAVDDRGNRSEPSAPLRGRSLHPPVVEPVWGAATWTAGDAVELVWSHPDNPRLACNVERRVAGSPLWTSASGWLPRGVYSFTDDPSDPTITWEYRLLVRDHLGQAAPRPPSLTVPARP